MPTALSGGIGAADLSFNVQDATGYPTGGASGPFYVTLARGAADEEKILCDSRSGLTFTVNATGRGADGTVATSHAASSTTVEHTITKTDLDEANAHVNDTTGDPHPQYLTPAEGSAAYVASSSLWLPASQFIGAEGAPSLGNAGAPAWLLDAATSERVATMVRLAPLGWATMHVDIYWGNAGAGAGNVTWRAFQEDFVAGETLGAGGSPGDVTDTAGAQNVLRPPFRVITGQAVPADLFFLSIRRDASAGTDTLANDAALYGVLLTKAS